MQIGQELTELCLKQKTKNYGLILLESSWNTKKPFSSRWIFSWCTPHAPFSGINHSYFIFADDVDPWPTTLMFHLLFYHYNFSAGTKLDPLNVLHTLLLTHLWQLDPIDYTHTVGLISQQRASDIAEIQTPGIWPSHAHAHQAKENSVILQTHYLI